jgi:GAF domain-containing protein
MLNATSAVIPDIYADPRVPGDAYRSTFVKSLAMVPVGRPIPFAAIGAYWARHHDATNEEVEILQALADSAALALQD